MQQAGDESLAGAVLARDKHVGVGGPDAGDDFQHRLHGRGLSDQARAVLAAQHPGLLLQALLRTQACSVGDLIAHDGEQTRVFPWLGDEVARAVVHGCNRQINRAPSGHHDDGQRGIE